MANLEALSGQVLRNASGTAYLSAKAYYWADVGVSVPLATFSNASLATPNTNPVVSDGTTGAFGSIYIAAKRYWRTVTTSAGVSLPEYNLGPIDGIPGLVESLTAPSPTYPFLMWWDTTTDHLKRRKSDDSGWLDLGAVDSLLNSASVTEQLAGTSTSVSATPDSVAALWERGTSITPSAGTLSLPSTGGGVYTVNAGNFSAISSASAGRVVILEFAGVCVMTHGASLDLQGNVNRTTAAGGRGAYVNEAAAGGTGSTWRELWYVTDDGSWPGVFATQTQQETGTQTTFPINSAVQHFHPSSIKAQGTVTNVPGTPTVGSGSYNLTGVTDNGAGDLTWNWTVSFSSAIYAMSGFANQESLGNCSSLYMTVRSATASTMIAASCRTSTGNAGTGTETDTEINTVIAAGDR